MGRNSPGHQEVKENSRKKEQNMHRNESLKVHGRFNYTLLVQPLLRTVWRFLKKLKIELPFDPAVSLLGIYPEKTIIRKDTCTPIFIAALFTIAKTWKQPKCPSTDEWIKMYVYIQWTLTQP